MAHRMEFSSLLTVGRGTCLLQIVAFLDAALVAPPARRLTEAEVRSEISLALSSHAARIVPGLVPQAPPPPPTGGDRKPRKPAAPTPTAIALGAAPYPFPKTQRKDHPVFVGEHTHMRFDVVPVHDRDCWVLSEPPGGGLLRRSQEAALALHVTLSPKPRALAVGVVVRNKFA